MASFTRLLLGLLVLTAPAIGETLPNGQQIIINNYMAPPPASSPAPSPAPSPSPSASPSPAPGEAPEAEGPNSLRMKLGLGGTSKGNVGLKGGIDLRGLYYLGLEAEGAFETRTGSRESDERAGSAHGKILLPLKSPLIDVTAKGGLGYTHHTMSGGKYSGFSVMAGVEAELLHRLVGGFEVTEHVGKKRLEKAAIYGAVRFTPRVLAGAEYSSTRLNGPKNSWTTLYISYRF